MTESATETVVSPTVSYTGLTPICGNTSPTYVSRCQPHFSWLAWTECCWGADTAMLDGARQHKESNLFLHLISNEV